MCVLPGKGSDFSFFQFCKNMFENIFCICILDIAYIHCLCWEGILYGLTNVQDTEQAIVHQLTKNKHF